MKGKPTQYTELVLAFLKGSFAVHLTFFIINFYLNPRSGNVAGNTTLIKLKSIKDTLEHLHGSFKCPFKKYSPALIRTKKAFFNFISIFSKKNFGRELFAQSFGLRYATSYQKINLNH